MVDAKSKLLAQNAGTRAALATALALSATDRVIGSQHMGLVLTNAATAGTQYGVTSRLLGNTNGAITRLKLVGRNGSFVLNGAAEAAAPFAAIEAAAIETASAANYPLTMRGARTWVADANAALYETDALGIQFPANTSFFVRTHRRVPHAPTPTAALSAGGVLPSGTARYYKITVIDNGLESYPSSEVTATPASTTLSVTLSWTAPLQGDKIRIYAGATGAETFLDEIPATATSYIDNGYRAAVGGATCPTANYTYQYSNYVLQTGESCNYNNQMQDLTQSTGALSVSATSAPIYGINVRPALLVGDDFATPSVVGIGDSIMSHVGVFQNQGYVGNPFYAANWFNKALIAAKINCLNAGMPTDQIAFLMGSVHNARARLSALRYARHVVSEYGTNDVYTGGAAWTAVAANQIALATMLVAGGHKFWLTTLLPRTTSAGGGFLTIADQTTSGTYESVRQNYNTWVRNGCQMNGATPVLTGGTPSPYVSGFFELAGAVEVNASGVLTLNGGYWNTPSAATITGTFTTGSTTTALNTTGLTIHQNDGKTLKVTSGAAAGQCALIQQNTSATAVTCYASAAQSETGVTVFAGLSIAPASGDAYQIWDVPTVDGVHPSLSGHATIAAAFQTWASANLTV